MRSRTKLCLLALSLMGCNSTEPLLTPLPPPSLQVAQDNVRVVPAERTGPAQAVAPTAPAPSALPPKPQAPAVPPAPEPPPGMGMVEPGPGEIRLRHILVGYAGSPGMVPGMKRTRDEALAFANELLKKIRDGGDFEAIAREQSDDRTAASMGGLLGNVSKGQMVPPFEQAAFALQAGQLSEVVETKFGFHIIRRDK